MKALKLTVYPQSRGMFGPQYDMPNGRHMLAREGADVMSRNKRLTDAELAAEWHRAVSSFRSACDLAEISPGPDAWADVERDRGWMYAMERFATLPHYDDPTETGTQA